MNPGPLRVSIAGVGAVTCAGLDLESFWKNALAEKTGLNDSGLGAISDAAVRILRARAPQSSSMSKPTLIAVAAIQEAMREAGWESLGPDDGLILATTVGQIPLWENELTSYLTGQIGVQEFGRAIAHQPLGSLVESISATLDFRGKSLLVTSACSASTQALGLASLWIRQGKVKRCLVGGVEVLSRLTVEGFRSLQLLASEHSRPFDANRRGINLSEGGAFFCLQSGESESPNAVAEICGVGFSTDAYHMTAPHPEGRGSFEAMSSAMRMADVSPAQISWIHAHGTGSKANDLSEGAAIHQLFGQLSGRANPPVSSTKGIHGHALAASGAIETALCVQAIRKQILLGTAGLLNPDPLIPLRHPRSGEPAVIRYILKNTLGFGGNNASLVLGAR